MASKVKILVVDDVEINRIILSSILADSYIMLEASNGIEALSLLHREKEKPSLILLDVVMPEMDGFETLRNILADPELQQIPVVFITSETDDEAKGLAAGAVDYIIKPFKSEIVQLRVATQIELVQHRSHLVHLVDQKAEELVKTKEVFLEMIADLIEYRSIESGQHVRRTKELSALLLRELSEHSPYQHILKSMNCSAMIKAVPLHDIGKIAIPDNILLKPGKLTEEEFEVIKTHTTEGAKMIDALIDSGVEDSYIRHCHDICLYHHEKWNGSGYPTGCAGDDIPLSARIVALVDVYDALTNDRCYKEAMSHEDASKMIEESSGSHFDPVVVQAFFAIQEEFKNYVLRYQ